MTNEEISTFNTNDFYEGVKHYNEFVPALEKDRTFYHNGTHIYITNNRAVLDTTYFSYLIKYCPMCRKEAGRVKRHASGYWYQFIIPKRLTLPPTRIYRWLNFYWRLKDKEDKQ